VSPPAPSPSPSVVAGVRYGNLARHDDVRGSFRELWRESELGVLQPELTAEDHGSAARATPQPRFRQANLSRSAPGVLRGLHYHRRQLDYWVVVAGRAFVALVDVRPLVGGRESRPVVETRVLEVDDWVVIPAGVAHGFLALDAIELLYLVTNEYDGTDELGFAWDDPEVAVPWPRLDTTVDGRPILSDRDRSNPPLADLLAQLGSVHP
jgi:dTDP-4-dehydrorhamnose 3,5-epimerase